MRHTTLLYQIYLCSLGIKKSNNMQNIHKFFYCKIQPKSLKRLTNTRVCTTVTKPMVKRCGCPKVGICHDLMKGSEFQFKEVKWLTIKTSITCPSQNLIYVIICSVFGDNCIGRTSMALKQRTTLHRE